MYTHTAEGQIFANEVTKFVEEVRLLGPLNWNKSADEIPAELKEEVAA